MNIPVSTTESANKFRKNLSLRFGQIIGDKSKAVNLEKGIFNYSIREAKSRKVVKKWENKHFVTIYMSKLWTIFNNIQNEQIIFLAKYNRCWRNTITEWMLVPTFRCHKTAFNKEFSILCNLHGDHGLEAVFECFMCSLNANTYVCTILTKTRTD